MEQVSHKTVVAQLAATLATNRAVQDATRLAGQQIYDARAGAIHAGAGATLIGGTEVIAP